MPRPTTEKIEGIQAQIQQLENERKGRPFREALLILKGKRPPGSFQS